MHLNGGTEVPANDSRGRADDPPGLGRHLARQADVANLDNPVRRTSTGAGVNGPVVAFLFGPPLQWDRERLIAEGTITSANLVGRWP